MAVKERRQKCVTGIQGDVAESLVTLIASFAQTKRGNGPLGFGSSIPGARRVLARVPRSFHDWTFDINVKGLLFTVQKALPLLPDGASPS